MRTLASFVLGLALLAPVAAPPALASAPMPLIARLEKVTIDVAGQVASLVIDGRYLVRNGVQKPFVAAGRLHYSCDKDKVAECIGTWSDLLRAAAGDKCVAWGQMGDKLPTPALPYGQLQKATPWKVGMGVAKLNPARCAEIDKPLEAP